ncbi:hypothetical protein SLEP1_g45174 [Rubroshorea leprosula]|uniref:Uncharacterized protein n=1 Tax=Rubroshorea leprosula TaxID=152421 RepID=A0AAV5LIY6_9ROSI|nr:hypothetical protein SLEP1_g45174 [Rubroshorea leprosula]
MMDCLLSTCFAHPHLLLLPDALPPDPLHPRSPPTTATHFQPEIRQSLGISPYFLVLEHLLNLENPRSASSSLCCPSASTCGFEISGHFSPRVPLQNFFFSAVGFSPLLGSVFAC